MTKPAISRATAIYFPGLLAFLFLILATPAAADFDKSRELAIMPMGDSLTQASTPGYRGFLYRALTDAGYKVDFVGNESNLPTEPVGAKLDPDHQGRGGFSVGPGPSAADAWSGGKGNLYVNLDEWLAPDNPKTKNVDIILLLIGINDFANIKERDPSYNLETQFTGRLGGLCDKILTLRPHAAILVSSILPGGNPETHAVFDMAFGSINPRIEAEVAQPRASHVFFYDGRNLQGTGLAWSPDDWGKGDVVHPVSAGYQKLAKFWFASIEDFLNRRGLPTAPYSDTKAPVPLDFSPPNGAKDADYNRPVSLHFDKSLFFKSGNVVLKNTSGGPDLTLDVADATQVKVVGSSVQLNPTGGLAPATTYVVQLPAGEIKDVFGNQVDPASVAYTFTTKPPTADLYAQTFKDNAEGWTKAADVEMKVVNGRFQATAAGQCLYTYTGDSFKGDRTIEATLSNASVERAGLVLTAQPGGAGYALVLDHEGAVEFHKLTNEFFHFNINGNTTLVATSSSAVRTPANGTYRVKIEIDDTAHTMNAFVDDKPVFTDQAIDTYPEGSVGFCCSYNGTGAGISDVHVEQAAKK